MRMMLFRHNLGRMLMTSGYGFVTRSPFLKLYFCRESWPNFQDVFGFSDVINTSCIAARMRSTMQMLVNFSTELKTWILHNLDRGCAPHDVADTMIAQEFKPEVAHGLVDAFVQARNAGVEPPSGSVM